MACYKLIIVFYLLALGHQQQPTNAIDNKPEIDNVVIANRSSYEKLKEMQFLSQMRPGRTIRDDGHLYFVGYMHGAKCTRLVEMQLQNSTNKGFPEIKYRATKHWMQSSPSWKWCLFWVTHYLLPILTFLIGRRLRNMEEFKCAQPKDHVAVTSCDELKGNIKVKCQDSERESTVPILPEVTLSKKDTNIKDVLTRIENIEPPANMYQFGTDLFGKENKEGNNALSNELANDSCSDMSFATIDSIECDGVMIANVAELKKNSELGNDENVKNIRNFAAGMNSLEHVVPEGIIANTLEKNCEETLSSSNERVSLDESIYQKNGQISVATQTGIESSIGEKGKLFQAVLYQRNGTESDKNPQGKNASVMRVGSQTAPDTLLDFEPSADHDLYLSYSEDDTDNLSSYHSLEDKTDAVSNYLNTMHVSSDDSEKVLETKATEKRITGKSCMSEGNSVNLGLNRDVQPSKENGEVVDDHWCRQEQPSKSNFLSSAADVSIATSNVIEANHFDNDDANETALLSDAGSDTGYFAKDTTEFVQDDKEDHENGDEIQELEDSAVFDLNIGSNDNMSQSTSKERAGAEKEQPSANVIKSSDPTISEGNIEQVSDFTEPKVGTVSNLVPERAENDQTEANVVAMKSFSVDDIVKYEGDSTVPCKLQVESNALCTSNEYLRIIGKEGDKVDEEPLPMLQESMHNDDFPNKRNERTNARCETEVHIDTRKEPFHEKGKEPSKIGLESPSYEDHERDLQLEATNESNIANSVTSSMVEIGLGLEQERKSDSTFSIEPKDSLLCNGNKNPLSRNNNSSEYKGSSSLPDNTCIFIPCAVAMSSKRGCQSILTRCGRRIRITNTRALRMHQRRPPCNGNTGQDLSVLRNSTNGSQRDMWINDQLKLQGSRRSNVSKDDSRDVLTQRWRMYRVQRFPPIQVTSVLTDNKHYKIVLNKKALNLIKDLTSYAVERGYKKRFQSELD